ncbi:hypothetical protein [Neorhodopirellula lusitana]|nr:hypothetical protein [Neorhodopirellula lusitana]
MRLAPRDGVLSELVDSVAVLALTAFDISVISERDQYKSFDGVGDTVGGI